MKKIFFILIGIISLIAYIYISSLDAIPNNIILFEDEDLNITTLFGITCNTIDENFDEVAVEASSNLNKSTIGEKSTLLFKLFNRITLKEVDVDVISNVKVVPVGNIIGLKLYTKGVLVVGMNAVETSSNESKKPYENSGIIEGDLIISVNNNTITCTNDLLDEVSKSYGEKLQVEYMRDGETYETDITPEKIEENQYKIGLWVRDSAARSGDNYLL